MKLTLRTVAAGTLLAAAGLTAFPSLAEAAGVDFWHTPNMHLGIASAEEEARRLDREGEATVRRTAVRFEIVGDVADGRRTFAEATARFVELNRSNPAALQYTRTMFPGDTDEARAAWQLVSHLRHFAHPKAKAAADAGAVWMAERY